MSFAESEALRHLHRLLIDLWAAEAQPTGADARTILTTIGEKLDPALARKLAHREAEIAALQENLKRRKSENRGLNRKLTAIQNKDLDASLAVDLQRRIANQRDEINALQRAFRVMPNETEGGGG